MDAVEFAEAQKSLRDRVNELVDIGELIKVERETNPEMGEKRRMKHHRKRYEEQGKETICQYILYGCIYGGVNL